MKKTFLTMLALLLLVALPLTGCKKKKPGDELPEETDAPGAVTAAPSATPRKDYPNPGDNVPEAGDIVKKENRYDYTQLTKDAEALQARFGTQLAVEEIGKTAAGRGIFALRLGKADTEHRVLIVAGIRGTEYGTSWLAMKQLETYLETMDHSYKNMKYTDVLARCSVWFVPMLNPDGIELNLSGLSSVPAEMQDTVKAAAAAGEKAGLMAKDDFSAWEANACGVDVSYDFGTGTVTWKAKMTEPAPKNYIGTHDFCSEEAAALTKLCRNYAFDAALSYSGTGKMVDWSFGQYKSRYLAKMYGDWLADLTGYSKIDNGPTPEMCLNVSFFQWFIKEFDRPGLNLMPGDMMPLSITEMNGLWNSLSVAPVYLAWETLQDHSDFEIPDEPGTPTNAPVTNAPATDAPVTTPPAVVTPGSATPTPGPDGPIVTPEVEYGELD